MAAMIESLGRRLRIVLGRNDGDLSLPDEPAARPNPPGLDVEFVAYSEDCVLSGRLRLSTDRLTDMLNEHDEYLLVDVLVKRLADGEGTEVKEVLVMRDELLLVHATGPRGNSARRHRTRSHPVALRVGPYHIHGYLHALPGSDPIQHMRRRKTMVPLTDAWIEYRSGALRHRLQVGTVVVNREQVEWIVAAEIEEVEMPDLVARADHGPLLKDFTGAILDF